MKNLDSSFVCCWLEQWCFLMMLILSCGTSFGYMAKPSLNSLLCLASGLSHPCNQNGMKCYDVVTRYYIVLEYNMQVMCNWMWCIIVEIYSMIVDYVLSIVYSRLQFHYSRLWFHFSRLQFHVSRVYIHFSRV